MTDNIVGYLYMFDDYSELLMPDEVEPGNFKKNPQMYQAVVLAGQCEGVLCSDCLDTGWLENREEGRYPCTCISEAEPYQELQAKITKQQTEIDQWRNGGYTNLWKLRTQDREATIESQRLILMDLRDKIGELKDKNEILSNELLRLEGIISNIDNEQLEVKTND